MRRPHSRSSRKAYYKISGQDRTYRPYFSDPEIELRILRPQEIPVYVADGVQDVGITGIDWIRETGANVEKVLDLEYGKVKIVTAFPKSAPYEKASDLMEDFWKKGKSVRVSAEYLNITADYLKSIPTYKKLFGKKEPMIITPWWRKGDNPKASVYLSFGATEAKPPEIVDIIVDVTETGTTLEQNNLRQAETIMVSTAHLVANKSALKDPWKREKIYDLKIMLERGRGGPEEAPHLRQREGGEPPEAPLAAARAEEADGKPALREGLVRRQHRDQQERPAQDAAHAEEASPGPGRPRAAADPLSRGVRGRERREMNELLPLIRVEGKDTPRAGRQDQGPRPRPGLRRGGGREDNREGQGGGRRAPLRELTLELDHAEIGGRSGWARTRSTGAREGRRRGCWRR